MSKTTILIFIVLLCSRCTTGQNNAGEFPKKINVIVKDEEGNIVKNKTVALMAAYYRLMSLKEDYMEYYRVTTNALGEATIVRGLGYKHHGSYDTIQKLLNEGNYANMHLFLLDDKEYEIKELGIFRPQCPNGRPNSKEEQRTAETRQVIENVVEPPVPLIPSGPDEMPDTTRSKPAGKFSTDPENWKLVIYVPNDKGAPPVIDSLVEGKYEKVISGLKIYTRSMGYTVMNRHRMNFDGHTIYFKWKAEMNGHWSEMSGKLYQEPDTKDFFLTSNGIFFMRFNTQSKHGFDYKDRDWIYTRVEFKNNRCKSYTASGNYDDQGGAVLLEADNYYTEVKGYFGFRMDDLANAAGGWVIIGEVKVK